MISESVHRRLIEKQISAHLLIDKTYSSADPAPESDPAPEPLDVVRKIMKPEYASAAQIAEQLGCSRDTVGEILKSALAKMRKQLTPVLIEMEYLDSEGNLI